MKTNMKTKRLDYLDLAKGIGIILVVIGHSTFAADGLLTWISSFHMPLFFIISGVVLQYTEEENRKMSDIIRRKLRGIMLPYVWFSLIYVLIDVAIMWLKQGENSIVEIQRSIIETFTFYGISVLWFLPALFLGETVFLWIRKRFSHMVTLIIGFAAVVVVSIGKPILDSSYPLYENMGFLWIGYLIIVILRGATAYVFLMMGYYSKRYLRENNKIQMKELFLAVALMLLNIAVSMQNGRVDLNTLAFKQPILYFLGAATGSFALILFCKNIRYGKSIRYLGTNSLIIMVTHLDCRVMITAINAAYWLNQYVTRAKSYILYFCIAVLVTLMELIIIYVINHYFPFLMGKSILKKRGKFKIVK